MNRYQLSDYVNYCVLLPLAFMAANLALCLVLRRFLCRRVRDARQAHTSLWAKPVSTGALLVGMVLSGVLAVTPVAMLWFTAPAALHPRAPVVTVQGTVDKVNRMPVSLPGPQGLTCHATVRVDGTEYYVFEASGLKAGDEITLRCPEGARVVLGYEAVSVSLPPELPLRELHFSRGVYLGGLLRAPAGVAALLLVELAATTLGRKKTDAPVNPLKTGAALAGILLALLLEAAFLARGLPLLSEGESDAVTARGVIDAMAQADRGMKFHTDYGTCFGWELVIQGQTYLIPTAGDLAPGDEVTFSYLPRSRCILECAAVSP